MKIHSVIVLNLYKLKTMLLGFLLLCCGLNISYSTLNVSHNPELLGLTLIVSILLIALPVYNRGPFIFYASDLLMFTVAILTLFLYLCFPSWQNSIAGCLLFLYLSIRLNTKIDLRILYVFLLIFLIVISVMGYMQYFNLLKSNHDYFIITGPYLNPSVYGCVISISLSVVLVFLVSAFYYKKHETLSVASVLTAAISIPILFISGSRTAVLSLMITVICIIYIRCRKNVKLTKRKIFLTITIFVLIFLCCSYPLYLYKKDSADGRFLIWKVTLEMIKDKPISGFGSDGFVANYMHYQANYLETTGTVREKYLAGNIHKVFNEPLRLLVEYGLVGLFIYVCFVALLFSMPQRNIVGKIVFVTGINYLVIGLFTYSYVIFPIQLIMLIVFSLSVFYSKKRLVIKSLDLSFKCLRLTKGTLIILMIAFSYPIFKSWVGYCKLNRISSKSGFRNSNKYISELASLECLMQTESIFWRYYCVALNKEKQDTMLLDKIINWEKLHPDPMVYILKGDVLKRNGNIAAAEQAYRIAAYMIPSMQTARGRLAFLYKDYGREEEGLMLAREILEEEVKVYGFATYELHQDLRDKFKLQTITKYH